MVELGLVPVRARPRARRVLPGRARRSRRGAALRRRGRGAAGRQPGGAGPAHRRDRSGGRRGGGGRGRRPAGRARRGGRAGPGQRGRHRRVPGRERGRRVRRRRRGQRLAPPVRPPHPPGALVLGAQPGPGGGQEHARPPHPVRADPVFLLRPVRRRHGVLRVRARLGPGRVPRRSGQPGVHRLLAEGRARGGRDERQLWDVADPIAALVAAAARSTFPACSTRTWSWPRWPADRARRAAAA